ncbi:MAG TPA: Crp/Fnr family transcriptional regulator [Candidatus Saccharimonadales bacterium]|jgi:CRP/FNR family cyclic AMP-dependent transcriptional regulator|nr:Crp/Fnr family transcriptional regulator [Candidatus Saccharimonadales bacterium]
MAYNFEIIEDCLKCTFREHRLFCDLPGEAVTKLQSIKATSVYPKGAMLCLEGQAPRGVYVLCTGRAKLSTTSSEGKTIILRIAEPGEVLGLTAALSNTPYEATVETLELSQTNFIPQTDFIRFLQEYPDVGMRVAQQLTHNCKCAYTEIRSLGLSNSVPEKIAKLLLNWAEHPLDSPNRKNSSEIAIRVTLTQEEIAQFAGTSRETVSRVLGDFKKKGWLRIKGATWSILNKQALEELVTT